MNEVTPRSNNIASITDNVTPDVPQVPTNSFLETNDLEDDEDDSFNEDDDDTPAGGEKIENPVSSNFQPFLNVADEENSTATNSEEPSLVPLNTKASEVAVIPNISQAGTVNVPNSPLIAITPEQNQ